MLARVSARQFAILIFQFSIFSPLFPPYTPYPAPYTLFVMPDIVLTTLNAKYAHAAFALRYLLANLSELKNQAELVEFDVSQRPVDALEAPLSRHPKIIGLG